MPNIRPISDLRNHFAEITRDVQSSKEPVFLTKNGVGTLVVMSMECYEEKEYENYVYNRLREAEIEAVEKAERFSHEEVMATAAAGIGGQTCIKSSFIGKFYKKPAASEQQILIKDRKECDCVLPFFVI